MGDSERGRGRLFVLSLGRPLLRFAVGGSSECGVGRPAMVRCVGEPSGVLGASSVSSWSSSSSGGFSSGAVLDTIIHDPNIPRQASFLPLGGFLCPLHWSHTSAGTSSSVSSEYEGYLTFGSLVKVFLSLPEAPPSPEPPELSFDSLQLHIFGCFFFLLLLAAPVWEAGPATLRKPFVFRSGVVGCVCGPRIGLLKAAILSSRSWNLSVCLSVNVYEA